MFTSLPWRLAGAALGAAVLTGTASCTVFKQIAGSNTVNLKGAQVSEMKLDLRRTAKTICPREPVQTAVHLRAKLAEEPAEKWLETWEGRDGANKNGKIDFEELAFKSPLGTVDRSGWFLPNRDLLASVDREFTLAAVYKAQPDRIKAVASFRPDYGCVASGGGRGLAGKPGSDGIGGTQGPDGSEGTPGSDGNSGTNGQPGLAGGPGPALQAFATFVKTPFYDKLIAVRVDGPTPDFLLFPPNQVVVVKASGGNGGRGGHGGDGGNGGNGGNGRPDPGDGGRGGHGGDGGRGGNGGDGGSLELIYDERFPELATAIQLDTSGGAPGISGASGRGGSGGKGGRRAVSTDTPLASTSDGERGSHGDQGRPGQPGQAGARGASSARPGRVLDWFNGIRGVTPQ